MNFHFFVTNAFFLLHVAAALHYGLQIADLTINLRAIKQILLKRSGRTRPSQVLSNRHGNSAKWR
jgi:hypothetical protein